MGDTKGRKTRRRSARSTPRRRIDINVEALDFRNFELLRKFVTEKGRILPRRITGMPAKLHRQLTRSIKRGRQALLIK